MKRKPTENDSDDVGLFAESFTDESSSEEEELVKTSAPGHVNSKVNRTPKRRRVKLKRSRETPQDVLISSNAAPESALSLESVIMQAVTADDEKLLFSTLKNVDLVVIRRSVSGVSPALIPRLVRLLAHRIITGPASLKSCGPWLREVLRQHLALVQAQPELLLELKSLKEQAQLRLQNRWALTELHGVAEEICASANWHVKQSKNRAGISDGKDFEIPPLVTFRESARTLSDTDS